MKPHPIRADLSGADTCTAHGLTVRVAAPVFALCRKLVEAGHDPARPLHAYRGSMLPLTVSSIGWGAKHTVETTDLAHRFFGTPGRQQVS
jgi:hypothetical protein